MKWDSHDSNGAGQATVRKILGDLLVIIIKGGSTLECECGSTEISSVRGQGENRGTLEYTPSMVVSSTHGTIGTHTEVAKVCQDCGNVVNSLIEIGEKDKIETRHDILSLVDRTLIQELEKEKIQRAIKNWLKPKCNFGSVKGQGIYETRDYIFKVFEFQYPVLSKYIE